MNAKRLVSVVALLSCALLLVSPAFACGVCEVTITKEPLYSGYTLPGGGWVDSDPTSGLELYTYYEWWILIQVCAPYEITNVRLWDRFGAEFGVAIVDWDGGDSGVAPITWTKGKSEKVFFYWNIGTLGAGECASVWLHVWTDINPAGRPEFTSYGCYYLNSGAVVKWLENGQQFSLETGRLAISTIEPPSV